MRISDNYELHEFKRSAKADAKGIDNTIPPFAINAIRILVKHLLQPINDATGWRNFISSGFRCSALNKAVGGSATSSHMKGEAADSNFYTLNGKKEKIYLSPIEVAKKVKELGLQFDQMILYPSFVHLSFSALKKNRNQILYNSSYKGEKL